MILKFWQQILNSFWNTALVCPNTSLGHMQPTGCQLWRWHPQRSGNTKNNCSCNRTNQSQGWAQCMLTALHTSSCFDPCHTLWQGCSCLHWTSEDSTQTTFPKFSQADLDLGKPNFKPYLLSIKSQGLHLLTTTTKLRKSPREGLWFDSEMVPLDRVTCLKHLVPSYWHHFGGRGNLEEVSPHWKMHITGGVGLEVSQSGFPYCLSPTCWQQTHFDKHPSLLQPQLPFWEWVYPSLNHKPKYTLFKNSFSSGMLPQKWQN